MNQVHLEKYMQKLNMLNCSKPCLSEQLEQLVITRSQVEKSNSTIFDIHGNIHSNNIKIATVNTRSIKSKEQILLRELIHNNIDILIVTETWLKNNQKDGLWIEMTDLNTEPFTLHTINRLDRVGGGIALIHKTSIKVTQIEVCQKPVFEYGIWKVDINGKCLTITGAYHPPDAKTNGIFIDSFAELMSNIIPNHPNNVVVGDFNLHVQKDTDVDAFVFNDTMSALGLDQHVSGTTHNKGNTLDLLFTEADSTVIPTACEFGPHTSDHRMVATLNLKKNHVKSKQINIQKLGAVDANSLNEAFIPENINFDIDTPLSDAVHQFNTEMQRTLDVVAPEKSVKVAIHAKQLWFDDDVKERHKVVKIGKGSGLSIKLMPLGKLIDMKGMFTIDY